MLHSLFISRTLLAFQFNFHELNIVYAAYTAFSSVHKSQICEANQWTGFYIITASIMKELAGY